MSEDNTCRGPKCNRPVLVKKNQLCNAHYQQWRNDKPLTPLRKVVKRKPAPAGYLHCTKCDNFKPVDQFYIRNNGKPQQHCKKCFIAENRQDTLARRAREATGATQ